MATGWWNAYPWNGPYAGSLSYLDYVVPATRQVTSPTITPQGVVREGASVDTSPTEGGAHTVGSAAQAATSGSMVPGISSLGMSSGAKGLANALALLGANPAALVGLPLAGQVFGLTNSLSAHLSALNTFQGVPVAEIAQTPEFTSQYSIMSSPASSPLSAATVGPLSANQAGFNLSPLSLGTPFSSNPPGVPSQTNFSGLTGRGDLSDSSAGQGQPGGQTSADAAAAGTAAGGELHRGGVVPNRAHGRLEERIVAQQGEYVVRRGPAMKYRGLLEAINRDRPMEIRRQVSKLGARMVAR